MTIDLLPTMADLIQADLPEHPIDGRSIWTLMTGESTSSPQDAYYFYYHENELHAMRSGKWKLHFPHSYRTMIEQEPGKDGIPGKYDNSVEIGLALYDLDNDLGESQDVSGLYPDVVERLSAMADTKRDELGDALTGSVGTGLREPGRVAGQ
jgi:arylsulfatase A-like enzyme